MHKSSKLTYCDCKLSTLVNFPCLYAVIRSCFGNINFFGGPSPTSVKASAKLQELESSNDDAMFVFLSDVWLDDIKVCMLLYLLFLYFCTVGMLWCNID